MEKIVSCIMAAVLAFASASGAVAAEKIRIVTEGTYPPFSSVNGKGELVGFDVDIAKALCKTMKAECEIVTQNWDGIIPGLMARKYDAVVASMSITEERKKAVDFTSPYYSNKLQFSGPKNKPLDISKAGLRGKTIGAQRATFAAIWFEQNYKGVDLKLYAGQEEVFSDMATGRLDGIIADVYVTYDWLQSKIGEKFEFKGPVLYDGDKVGIAVRKGDALRERLNSALKTIRENGTYAKINARYFPFDIY